MKVLNFGSLNVDYVYSVDHMVKEGETLSCQEMNIFCGGKGLNQSIALAKAGVTVYHAGFIGEDGGILLEALQENGVHTDFVKSLPGRGGHTMLQVDKNGQNSILVYGGTNRKYTKEFIAGNKKSFAFLGQSGIGKSHLMIAISRKLLEAGINVKHYTADEITQKLQACKYDEQKDVNQNWCCRWRFSTCSGCSITNSESYIKC